MRARMTGFAVRSTQGKCRGWGLLCSVAAATLMAVCCLIPSLSACASGARDYPVCPVGQRPVLDGKLDEPIWAELPSAKGFLVLGEQGFAWEKPTEFRMGWGHDCLYIGLSCKEPFSHHMFSLPEDGGNLWEDDSLEIFISPDGKGYRQFVANSAGARWNGRDGSKLDVIQDWEVGVAVSGDYWTAEICLPFSLLGETPVEGDSWKFNIARNVTTGPAKEKHSSWAPVETGFRDVAHFTRMVFSGKVLSAEERASAEQRMNERFGKFSEVARNSVKTLVSNGSFGDGLKNWYRRLPDRVSIDETTSTIGRQSIFLDGRMGAADAPHFVSASQNLNLKPGTRYILRADIKRTRDADGISVSVIERDASNGKVWYHSVGDRVRKGDVAGKPGQWERYQLRFETGKNLHEASLQIYNVRSNAGAWYDNIQLIEDDGSKLDAVRRSQDRKKLTLEVEVREASATLLVNGEEVEQAAGVYSGWVHEGMNVLSVDASAEGKNPGIKIRVQGHPYTDGRWCVSPGEPPADWTTADWDDRGWDMAAPDADGYIWAGNGSERMAGRQLILWNRGHDGPDRCINPLIKEWGISEGSAETLFLAVYSPFPFPVKDYEFIFDVPAGFRLLEFMQREARHPLNTRPSGWVQEPVVHDGVPYTRHRISFAEGDMYAEQTRTVTAYLLLPVYLEEWKGKGTTTSWYYRRQAKGNFTELQQEMPVRILPPINGRMLKKIMISQYSPIPFLSGRPSPEHWEHFLKQSFRAGFNTWMMSQWYLPASDGHKIMHDAVTKEDNGRIILFNNYPYYGARERLHRGKPDTLRFLYRWLEETPEARARYWGDSETWETRGQYCPTYALGEGRADFYRGILENFRLKLKHLPSASIVWSDYEEAPWLSWRPRDGKKCFCFCDRCKESFRRWAKLPEDADLSDENIFRSYQSSWHSFRSYLDGELAGVARKAANELGREYMVYTWWRHRDFWAAMNGHIDRAFVGWPGNGTADSRLQESIDHCASYMRDKVGLERRQVMGQRFLWGWRYAWKREQSHQNYWRNNWGVFSRSGYLEPKTWKSQVLRVVAGFGGGIDLQRSFQCVGGTLYWVGEATRILAAYEDIFHTGKRADDLASSEQIAYPDLLVLKLGDERVVLLFNKGESPLDVVLTNREIRQGQTAEVFGTGTKMKNPAKMSVTVPAQDVAVVHID